MINTKLLYLYQILSVIIPETKLFKLKAILLQICGVSCTRNIKVCSSARFYGSGKIIIRDNVWIGPHVKIFTSFGNKVIIDKNVDIGPCVYIGTGTHIKGEGLNKVAGKSVGYDISIGSGSWIGACSVLLPNIKIGERVIVGAGSIVINSLPPNSICVGNPCKFKNKLI